MGANTKFSVAAIVGASALVLGLVPATVSSATEVQTTSQVQAQAKKSKKKAKKVKDGRLRVKVQGLPVGLNAKVTVTGPKQTKKSAKYLRTVKATVKYYGLKPGKYKVSAADVNYKSGTYKPTKTLVTRKVKNGMMRTATVTYKFKQTKYAPTAPRSVEAVSGDAEITVSWLAPNSDGGSSITGYRVTSIPAGGGCQTTGELTCVVEGLTIGEEYEFVVTAVNAEGDSPESAPSDGVYFHDCIAGPEKLLMNCNFAQSRMVSVDLAGSDLTGANLSAAMLEGGDLSGAILENANLTGANLAGALMLNTIVAGANFTDASLTNVRGQEIVGKATLPNNWALIGGNLVGPTANLTRARLSDLNLSGANLAGASLVRAVLDGANLTNADLATANLTGASAKDAQLTGADVTAANLSAADFTGADLTSVDLSLAKLDAANFQDAHMAGAHLAGIDLSSVGLAGANLTGADLTGSLITESSLRRTNLTSALLVDATMWGVDLGAADLTSASLTGIESGRLTGTPKAMPAGWSIMGGRFVNTR